MRVGDPFPIPDYQGLSPTHALDWPAMARTVVQGVLRLGRHERVVLSANPYHGGAMLEALRGEIQRAGAIELATILHWTPGLAGLRGPDGCRTDPADAEAEERAMAELFALADVFVWLMNDWRPPRATHAVGQTERILERWRGRAIHFHWFHDPNAPDPDSPVNRALDLVYQRAVLELDYAALRRRMGALAGRLANRVVRITDPAGTDLALRLGARFHVNAGDASRERVASAASPRDREEEVPCGALRTIPEPDSADGVLAFAGSFGFSAVGSGLDLDPFLAAGLRIHFRDGRIVGLETAGDQARLDAGWAAETGDRDRVGEMVLGCNPLLRPVPGSTFLPYYGFGEGMLRIVIGENRESGGRNRSSLHRWLYLREATIRVDGEPLVEGGRFTPAALGTP
jgi:hypothetical protein